MTTSMEDIDKSWQEEENEEILFRHLLRFYALASITDYYMPNGTWDTQKLKCDLSLIVANRHEAGAPQPLDLEDVEMPELPAVKSFRRERENSRTQSTGKSVAARAPLQPGLYESGRSRSVRDRSRSRGCDLSRSRSRLGRAVEARPVSAREAVSATLRRRSL
mmetsp:Transcript_31398/g.57668  ORF Transcript_31398/g.57668 Transcript_31398/m.57668 type:complete len:163 (-) Transcript_31398:153-641(-)